MPIVLNLLIFGLSVVKADPVHIIAAKEVALLTISGDTCSGSIVKERNQKLLLASAAHCLPDKPGYLSLVNPLHNNDEDQVTLRSDRVTAHPEHDIFFSRISTSGGYKIKEIATTRPNPNSEIFIEGYPNGLEATNGFGVPSKMKCIYVGPVLSYLKPFKTSIISQLARCPFIGEAHGLSGGPVLNERDEVMGIVSVGAMRAPDGESGIIFDFLNTAEEKDGVHSFANLHLDAWPLNLYWGQFTFHSGVLDGPFVILDAKGEKDRGFFLKGHLQSESVRPIEN